MKSPQSPQPPSQQPAQPKPPKSKLMTQINQLTQVVNGVLKNDQLIMKNPAPEVLTGNLSNGSIEINCFFWCADLSKAEFIKGKVLENIYDVFKKHSITLKDNLNLEINTIGS